MLHKTVGIVLQTTKYSDTSIIVNMYTQHFGLQSYMISGARSKKSKSKATLFQPLALVDMEVINSEKSTLHRISEISVHYHYTQIPFNIIKSTVAIFLNELLARSLKESHPDEDMFEFIKNSLQILDLSQDSTANFHLCFMIQLSRYLGFYPQGVFGENASVFDLQEGKFVNYTPQHPHYLHAKQSSLFYALMTVGYDSVHLLSFDRTERKQLLQAMILYYQLHISSFGVLKSLEVLEEVIS